MIFTSNVPKCGQRGQESEGTEERHALARELVRGGCWYSVRGDTARGWKGTLKASDRLREKDGTEMMGLMRGVGYHSLCLLFYLSL